MCIRDRHKAETKKRPLYFTVQQPFFSLFFTFCRVVFLAVLALIQRIELLYDLRVLQLDDLAGEDVYKR